MIEHGRLRAALSKMQLKTPDIFNARSIGRAADKRGKVLTVPM
jgi:hypothetical protein